MSWRVLALCHDYLGLLPLPPSSQCLGMSGTGIKELRALQSTIHLAPLDSPSQSSKSMPYVSPQFLSSTFVKCFFAVGSNTFFLVPDKSGCDHIFFSVIRK